MTLEITAPDGVPEVRPGDDLVALIMAVVDVADGDVVVVTSKVVSKAEGRLRSGDRDRPFRRPSSRRRSGWLPAAARRRSSAIVSG